MKLFQLLNNDFLKHVYSIYKLPNSELRAYNPIYRSYRRGGGDEGSIGRVKVKSAKTDFFGKLFFVKINRELTCKALNKQKNIGKTKKLARTKGSRQKKFFF